jgi:hypothetical protein
MSRRFGFWLAVLTLSVLPAISDVPAAVTKYRGRIIAETSASSVRRIVGKDKRFAADCAPLESHKIVGDCGPKVVNVKPAADCHEVHVRQIGRTVIVDYDRKRGGKADPNGPLTHLALPRSAGPPPSPAPSK